MKVIFMLIFILAASSCSANQEMSAIAKIYYVPIGVETYVPVTIDSIESQHARYGELSIDSREFKKLMSIIDGANVGSFDDRVVRVKILLSDLNAIYIDNDGGVRASSSDAKLSSSALKKVKKLLEKVTTPRVR